MNFKQFMKSTYTVEELKNITENGFISRWIPDIYNKHKDELWKYLTNFVNETGEYKNVLSFLESLDCNFPVSNDATLENLIVQCVAERIAQDLIDEKNNYLTEE